MNTYTKSMLSLLLFLAATTGYVIAQPVVQGSPQILVEGKSTSFMKPVWAPSGDKIAFTSIRNKGLWVADKNGNTVRQITDEIAGNGFSWSTDSESILTRVSEFENRRRKMAIKIFHTDGKEPTQITDARDRMPAIPKWANFDQQVVLISDSEVEAFDSQKEIPARLKQQSIQPFYVLKSNQIAKGMVPENSTENISPFEDAEYLNLEVSPDGRKLAFEVYGGNLYVMNIDGTGLTDLGKANRPRWAPDSNYLIAMVAEDNGHNYTKSDLVAFSTDGSQRVNLTENTELIALNPDWSPQGNQIVFDTPDKGNIYILNISY